MMKMLASALLAIPIACLATAQAQESPTAAERLESLAWLAGTWKSDSFETHYTSPEGGLILSVSKHYEGGRAAFFEFERFEVRGEDVVLVPYPGGDESVSFRLVGHHPDAKKAVFENKEHDFPTSLTYELRAPDNLTIVVAGPQGGREASFALDLKRSEQP